VSHVHVSRVRRCLTASPASIRARSCIIQKILAGCRLPYSGSTTRVTVSYLLRARYFPIIQYE
jgi:hypothetical protein